MDQKHTLVSNLNSKVIVRRTFWLLYSVEIFIVLLDAFVNHYKWSSISAIRRMVNISREGSFGNWFSSSQLFFTGVIVWIIAFAVRKSAQNEKDKKKFYYWACLAAFFTYMGIDDAIKFHERIGTTAKILLNRSVESSGPGVLSNLYSIFPSYSWQFVFGPFFISMAIFIVWFLLRELPTHKLKSAVLIALCMYAFAVGLDFIEGLKGHQEFIDYFSLKSKHTKHMLRAVEEFFEMLGTTIFLVVFLEYLFLCVKRWKINIL